MHEIIVIEKKYINQEDGLTTVSFQLPYRDWLRLERSDAWHRVEELLLEMKKSIMRKE